MISLSRVATSVWEGLEWVQWLGFMSTEWIHVMVVINAVRMNMSDLQYLKCALTSEYKKK